MTNGNRQAGDTGLGGWVKNNVAPLVTLATLFSVLFGAYFWLENHYARAEQVAQLEQRFEIKVTSDFLRETNARIWQLEDRLQAQPDDLTAKEEHRKLKEEKARLERQLEILYQKRP